MGGIGVATVYYIIISRPNVIIIVIINLNSTFLHSNFIAEPHIPGYIPIPTRDILPTYLLYPRSSGYIPQVVPAEH